MREPEVDLRGIDLRADSARERATEPGSQLALEVGLLFAREVVVRYRHRLDAILRYLWRESVQSLAEIEAQAPSDIPGLIRAQAGVLALHCDPVWLRAQHREHAAAVGALRELRDAYPALDVPLRVLQELESCTAKALEVQAGLPTDMVPLGSGHDTATKEAAIIPSLATCWRKVTGETVRVRYMSAERNIGEVVSAVQRFGRDGAPESTALARSESIIEAVRELLAGIERTETFLAASGAAFEARLRASDVDSDSDSDSDSVSEHDDAADGGDGGDGGDATTNDFDAAYQVLGQMLARTIKHDPPEPD